MHHHTPGTRSAFTLIEILIVVVILGILAAMVIPQFTAATNDARAGNLKAQLATLNRQIELYRIRTGVYPGFAQTGTMVINGNTEAGDWEPLINSGLLNTSPANPAFFPTGIAAKEVTLISGAGIKGVAGNGWAWNSTDSILYASFFNEATGIISALATD